MMARAPWMREVVEAVAEALRSGGLPDARTGRLDSTTGREGTVVRAVGYTATDRNLDGCEEGQLAVQVVVRRFSELDAMDGCMAAADALDGCDLGPLEGCEVADVQVYTAPQELDAPDAGPYTWSLQVVALTARWAPKR